MKKKAYPVEPWRNVTPQYSIDKFLTSFQDVLQLQQSVGRDKAVAEVTNEWKTTERDDFINWMKFYEGSNHLKYKKAFVSNNGVYVPGDNAKLTALQMPAAIAPAPAKPVELPPEDPNKANLTAHKKKIISRLDSLEKLLRSDISQQFNGIEFTDLIRNIHDLKSKFYTLKIASNQTVNDMIIRTSNQMVARGHINAADMLIKHAQVSKPSPPVSPTQNVDNAAPANNQQTTTMTSLDSPPAPAIDLSAVPPEMDIEEEEESPEEEFLENMSGGLYTNIDSQESSDDEEEEVLFVLDDDSDDTEDLEAVASDSDVLITVFAQEQQVSPSLPLPKPDLSTPEEAPVNTDPASQTAVPASKEDSALELSSTDNDIDILIDQAFGKVTPEMVIKKLEEISKIFKTKEISRQLAVVDIMLGRLGFASFFPALSEASGKAIESSNYIASRIDNVLSSLRGVVETDGIDLVNGDGSTDPKLQAMQAKLQQQQDKEEARKAARQEQDNKETPVIDIEQPATVVPEANTAPVPTTTTPVAV